jgi:hypothetical protein
MLLYVFYKFDSYVDWKPAGESLLTCFVQNEYAATLAKRVHEAKAQKADLRKRRASSMRK